MKFRRSLLSIAMILISFSCTALIAGCGQKATVNKEPASPTVPPSASTGVTKGVSLSPRSFQTADFTDFFDKAKQAGTVVSWAGDWKELGADNSAPKVVAELAVKYSYVPVIEAQFFTQSSGKLLRTLDEMTRQSYKNYAVEFARKYTPKYLALGIEVNVLWEKSPKDFEQFVPFYVEVYDAVKAVSPKTKVFTIFQLEKMKGLSGGLFGGVNDPTKAEWHVLDRFPKLDVVGFTTYPGLIYKSPSDIPADYYAEIKAHTSKPIAFTEIDWHSSASPAGWESSEAEQAQFVVRFFSLTKDLGAELAIWSFMYDQKAAEPFNSMGLRRGDGTSRLAWDEWVKAR